MRCRRISLSSIRDLPQPFPSILIPFYQYEHLHNISIQSSFINVVYQKNKYFW